MENENADGSIKFPSRLKYIAALVSALCLILIVIHAVFQQLTIDSTTIALIIVLLFPWLIPYIKTVKLPGGTELTFKDEVQKLEKLSKKSALSKITIEGVARPPAPPVEPTRWNLFRVDPNLALASLRIEIEKKLRQIASQRELRVEGVPLRGILSTLQAKGILASSEFQILTLIIDICNRAVHAEKVDIETASRILEIGESASMYLDSLMK